MRIALISALCVAAGAAAPASAQIVRGEFETGMLSPPITSDRKDGTMSPPETWKIVLNDTIYPSWVDFADHVTSDVGVGRYFIGDGTDKGFGLVWAQLVKVDPKTDYILSAWLANLFPELPAPVRFRVVGIGGEILSPTFSAPKDIAEWDERKFVFNTGKNELVSLQFWVFNDQFTGIDHAIDDIGLAAVPPPGAMALMGVGGLLLTRRRRAKSA